MNVPSLIPGRQATKPEASPNQDSATVLRFRTHGTPGPAAPSRPRRNSSDGTSALAVPIAAATPRRLHAVGSHSEQKWVAQLAARITGAAVEVLAGDRPVHQLAAWVPRDILASLQLRASLSREDAPGAARVLALAHRGASIRSSRATMVRPGIYEACTVVADRLRCRAVALRLEHLDGTGWRVTALEIG